MLQRLILFSWTLLLYIYCFHCKKFVVVLRWLHVQSAFIWRHLEEFFNQINMSFFNLFLFITFLSIIFMEYLFFLMPFPWNTMLMVCLAIQVPFWISKFFTDDFGVPIPTRELFWSLILTLLIPLILGKVPSSAFSSSYCTEVSLILGKHLNTS